MSKRVFISTSTFAQFSRKPLEMMELLGINYTLNTKGRKLTKNEIFKIIPHYDYVLAGTETYDVDVLNNAKNLKIISRIGIGLDNIDLDYASEKKIKIIRTKTTPAVAVSELTIALILNLLRKIHQQNIDYNSHRWVKKMGSLFHNKTLGVIGLGKIGKELVRILRGFNLKIIAFDLHEDKSFSDKYCVDYCSLDDLLMKSDIITIHLSLNKENIDLIDIEKLIKMKPEAILINTSRGEVINEGDLIEALKRKIIAGVALDVFKNEPYNGELKNFENVLLTPHIGSYAIETRITMEIEATKNLINGIGNE